MVEKDEKVIILVKYIIEKVLTVESRVYRLIAIVIGTILYKSTENNDYHSYS